MPHEAKSETFTMDGLSPHHAISVTIEHLTATVIRYPFRCLKPSSMSSMSFCELVGREIQAVATKNGLNLLRFNFPYNTNTSAGSYSYAPAAQLRMPARYVEIICIARHA